MRILVFAVLTAIMVLALSSCLPPPDDGLTPPPDDPVLDPPAEWTFCAIERQFCDFEGTALVRYGLDGSYFYQEHTDGVMCENAVFGDPLKGETKECYYSYTATNPVTPPPEPVDPPPSPIDELELYGVLFDESLVFFVGFDDASAMGFDSSAYGRTGTVSSDIASSQGKHGSAAALDGQGNNNITFAYDTALGMDASITIAAWVYRVGSGQESTSIIAGRPVMTRPGHQHYAIGLAPNNSIRWRLRFGESLVNVYSDPIPDRTWTHVAATYDGSAMRLYLNGELSSHISRTGLFSAASAPLLIGTDLSSDGRRFSGRADEIAVYAKSLSADEVRLLYGLDNGLQPLLDKYVEPGSAKPIFSPPDDPLPPPSGDRELTLRGDPNFHVSQLPSAQRVHYERLLSEINDNNNRAAMQKLIDTDDHFVYARTIHGYVQSLLNSFRVTGDLRLLDRVDEITQGMRANLGYGWRDTLDGTDGTDKKYLMWVYRNTNEPSYYGKDLKINDLKVNALIAMVAHTLDINRDLQSPGGRKYGANADFWKGYLVNHYEAKWRERSKKATGHPITTPHSDSHSFTNYVKGCYYMWKLTGDQAWLNEANRAASILWDKEIRDVAVYDNEPFSAYVWTSNLRSMTTSRNFLQSVAYANSNYGDAVTFHLEGFHNWADPVHMRNLARSITEFQFTKADGTRYTSPSDILSHGISQDIGGNVERAGIPPNNEVPRRTASAYVNYQTPIISAWDPSGEIAAVAKVVQDRYPELDNTRQAAGLFLYAYYHE
jgi:hypothetical protein